MTLQPGQSLLQYRLIEMIGEGGMGAVYRATDTRLERDVALKVLPADLAADPERLERFQREAKAVAALNHPHIVTLFNIEHDGDTHFLTMELVEGSSLDRMLTPGGLALPQVFDIGIALADALAAAHEKGIVHRDLKPANVMIGPDQRVKVLDFGLAKLAAGETAAPGTLDSTSVATAAAAPGRGLTQAGTVMGTAPYMSPEQLAGKPVDHRTDIFALGVVLYEMAVGHRPFAGESSAELVSSIMRDAPQPVTELRRDLPNHLGRIVNHCLEKGVTDRFQSALDIRNELRMLRKEIDSKVSSVSGVGPAASGTVLPATGTAHEPALTPPPAPAAQPPMTASGGQPPVSQPAAPPASSEMPPQAPPMPTPSQGMPAQATGSEVHPPASTPPTAYPSGIEPGSKGRGALWGALGGAAVVIALMVAFWMGQRGKDDAGGDATATDSAGVAATRSGSGSAREASTAAPVEGASLAVLPFADRSPERDQEYFTDGLSEELMNALGGIEDLRVAGRTSSFAFKNKEVPLREIGEQLGVDNILEGSVRKSGDQIRVSVQLVKADDGFQLWSETYDRTLEDVFTVQDDIASSVAEALEMTLLGTASAGDGDKANAEAYDLVLQARYIMKNTTEENMTRARELLGQATELAPQFAPAWAETGLAHVKAASLLSASSEISREYIEARSALQRALDLDPDLAEAHSRMAYIQSSLDWDFAAAERSTERALAVAPNNPIVLGNAANLYSTLGRLDESIALNEKVSESDPFNLTNYQNLGVAYNLVGRFDEAEAIWERGLKLEPDHLGILINLGLFRLRHGDIDEGRDALGRVVELLGNDPNWKLSLEAMSEFYAGNLKRAETLMLEYEEKYCDSEPTSCASFAAIRGRADETFAWLEKAYAIRDPLLPDYKTDPDVSQFSNDPRWDPFWKKVGF